MFKVAWQQKFILILMMFIMVWANAVHATKTLQMQIISHHQMASTLCHDMMEIEQQHTTDQPSILQHQECAMHMKHASDQKQQVHSKSHQISCQECLTLHCVMTYSAVLPIDVILPHPTFQPSINTFKTDYQIHWQSADLTKILRPPKA